MLLQVGLPRKLTLRRSSKYMIFALGINPMKGQGMKQDWEEETYIWLWPKDKLPITGSSGGHSMVSGRPGHYTYTSISHWTWALLGSGAETLGQAALHGQATPQEAIEQPPRQRQQGPSINGDPKGDAPYTQMKI